MAKVAAIQSVLNGGEFSPLMEGRVDFTKYKSGLKTCLNHIVLPQGPIIRRPGTYYVVPVKDSTKKTRLERFEFSTTQAYILEFGDLYFRICKDHAQIVSGTPVEVVTPYTEAQLFELKFVQSADVLYVAHPSHAPRKISRTSHTAWTISTISFKDGPYFPINATTTTLALGGTTGSVTVTASAVTGINGGAGFATTDVGRLIRWKDPAGNWTWLTITAWTSTTVVTATISGPNVSAVTATVNWRLGMYSDTTGYPGAVGFFQDRLTWAGSSGSPQSLQFSVTGDYENHAPSAANGTVAADNAINITLNSGDVQLIRWMVPAEKGFMVGTVAGEWIVGPSTTTEAFSATNVRADEVSHHGSANIQAIKMGAATLFLQRARRKLRELAYVFTNDKFSTPDMTLLSPHITLGGVVDMAYQQEPHSVLWCVRADGALLGLTYERDENVVGWHRHWFGGYSDAAHETSALVESVAVIPAPDGTRDELWMIVKRYINGVSVCTIEYMTKTWERGDAQEDAIYMDCALTYDGVAASTITGATHLAGETVDVMADGAAHPQCVVSATGEIALDRASFVVQIGYGYNSDGQTLRNDAGAADGTAQGKLQRKHRVIFRVLDSLGIEIGPTFDKLHMVVERTSAVSAGTMVPLATRDVGGGDLWEGGYSTEDLVCWRFRQPFPGTILAIMPQQATQDR